MMDTAIIEVSDSDSLDESSPPISHKCVQKLTQKGCATETVTKKARTDATVKQTVMICNVLELAGLTSHSPRPDA